MLNSFGKEKTTWPAQQWAAVKTQFSSEMRQFVKNVPFSESFGCFIKPMIEPPQKWVSPTAPTDRRDT